MLARRDVRVFCAVSALEKLRYFIRGIINGGRIADFKSSFSIGRREINKYGIVFLTCIDCIVYENTNVISKQVFGRVLFRTVEYILNKMDMPFCSAEEKRLYNAAANKGIFICIKG